MKAEIIAIGTELVSGQSLDTNSQWLSRALGALGIPVHFHTAIGDDLLENVDAFRVAIGRADLIITSGGLGPTQDDLTREALAAVSGVGLVEDAGSLEAIQALFARRNRVMSERNRVQALFPEGAEPLPNPIGTAPGIAMKVGRASFACLPGVPNEMKRMFDEQVIPWLARQGMASRRIVHRKINLFGRGESEVEAQALDLTARGRVPEVGITASEATIAFRISAEAATDEEALRLIEPTAALIYERFADLIVGEGSDDVVDALVRELARTGRTIATAESCTGGLVAQMITSVPGVSLHYPGGLVTYSVESKASLLDVPRALLESKGAVSPEVAGEMARRVRERFRADLGLSVTGIAGPSTDDPSHPVGLVYLGLSTLDEVRTRKLELGPEQPRDVIRRRAAKQALNWARLTLKHQLDRPST
jgi:nicotinamide-nucleotide amidase